MTAGEAVLAMFDGALYRRGSPNNSGDPNSASLTLFTHPWPHWWLI